VLALVAYALKLGLGEAIEAVRSAPVERHYEMAVLAVLADVAKPVLVERSDDVALGRGGLRGLHGPQIGTDKRGRAEKAPDTWQCRGLAFCVTAARFGLGAGAPTR